MSETISHRAARDLRNVRLLADNASPYAEQAAQEDWCCTQPEGFAGEPRSGLLDLVLSVLFGCEFAGIDVAFVQFRILLPLLRQVIQYKNRRNGADGNAGAAIDAFHGINVELGTSSNVFRPSS